MTISKSKKEHILRIGIIALEFFEHVVELVDSHENLEEELKESQSIIQQMISDNQYLEEELERTKEEVSLIH